MDLVRHVEYLRYERELERKALELMKGAPPMLNITPYIELVRAADALGFDVVRRESKAGDDLCI